MSDVEDMFEAKGEIMMLPTLERDTHADSVPERWLRLRIVSVSERLWRVVAPDGRIVGHLAAVGSGENERFVARRFSVTRGGFSDVGEFWSSREALDCLRLSR